MDEPAEIAAGIVDAVAAAIEPEARASIVLDAEIVAHRRLLGAALPPFAMNPLGAVGADHPMGATTPGEARRRAIGQQRDHRARRLGWIEQANRPRPMRRP